MQRPRFTSRPPAGPKTIWQGRCRVCAGNLGWDGLGEEYLCLACGRSETDAERDLQNRENREILEWLGN